MNLSASHTSSWPLSCQASGTARGRVGDQHSIMNHFVCCAVQTRCSCSFQVRQQVATVHTCWLNLRTRCGTAGRAYCCVITASAWALTFELHCRQISPDLLAQVLVVLPVVVVVIPAPHSVQAPLSIVFFQKPMAHSTQTPLSSVYPGSHSAGIHINSKLFKMAPHIPKICTVQQLAGVLAVTATPEPPAAASMSSLQEVSGLWS